MTPVVASSFERPRRFAAAAVAALIAAFMSALLASPAFAQVGQVSGLALPRYVSLKADRVNLREGPSREHRTAWVFQRAGLPVEITAEFENWRKIRDSEGSEGWVLHSLLSGRRTAIVAPWRKGETLPLHSDSSDKAPVVAKLESGVIANVKSCDKTWCSVFGKGFEGYIEQSQLWGVYANERIE